MLHLTVVQFTFYNIPKIFDFGLDVIWHFRLFVEFFITEQHASSNKPAQE